MRQVKKTERGYAMLFQETEKLVKRVRRVNLEAMDNYINGAKLRASLVNLIHSWDKFTHEVEGVHKEYPVRVKISDKVPGKGDNDGS